VVLTCAVTGPAEAKCRRAVRRLRALAPLAPVVACGCAAQASAEALLLSGASAVVGNRRKAEIPDLLESLLSEEGKGEGAEGRTKGSLLLAPDLASSRRWDDLVLDRPRLHLRAFLRIQEGCDRACAYCIVPLLRGPSVFRDPRAVAEEAERVAAAGCAEIVLTGVCLAGGQGRLPAILRALAPIRGIRRLRFGSIEPFAVDEEFLRALEDLPFCPHLHLPLQSGDDGVLARMRRGYRAVDFARTTERIRDRFGDRIHLGTDLLVGHPGEDEGAFERSLAFVRSLGFGRLHVFPFSPRAGTPAARDPDRVPTGRIRERADRALALARESLEAYAARFVGERVEVLVEEVGPEGSREPEGGGRPRGGTVARTASGLSPHYLRVRFPTPPSVRPGMSVLVRVGRAGEGGELAGEAEETPV